MKGHNLAGLPIMWLFRFWWIGCLGLISLFPSLTLAECPSETETSVPAGPYSTDIQLSELLPNPSTSETEDEFIELYNDGAEEVDLTGWQIVDASGQAYTLADTISAGRYYAWYRSDTRISLNNTGDTVSLLQPDGTELDSVSYDDSVDDDTSYALTNDSTWEWTTELTPYLENTFPKIAKEEEEEGEVEQDETDDTDAPLEPSYEYTNDVTLSELLPDPEGSDTTDEWIELYNSGEEVDLYGWMLTDGGHEYVIDESLALTANSYLLFSVTTTGISLNNSGETIQLLDPQNEVISEVTYDAAPTGESYALVNDTWQWTTTLSPEDTNVITAPVSEEEADTEEAVESTTETTEQSTGVSLLAVKQLPSGEEVSVTGTVLVLPDTFSSNYFYMQDDTSGIQIYSSDKSFPDLTIGDVISVTGKTSTSNGEPKINIASENDIMVTDHVDAIAPLEIDSFVTADAGRLVQVSGEVESKSGSTITLDNAWDMYVKRGTDISTSVFVEGELVTVIGVLVSTDDAIQVWPRQTSDVINATTAVATTSALRDAVVTPAYAASDHTVSIPAASQAPEYGRWWIWLAVTAGIVALSLRLWRIVWLRTLVRNWIVARVRGWGGPLGRWAASKKSTTGLNDQNQYHESHPVGKTTVSITPLNPPSAVRYVPVPRQS